MNRVVIPSDMRPYLRVLNVNSPVGEIPQNWDCYAVLQPQSYEYYSGLAKNPYLLLDKLLTYDPKKSNAFGYALRKLLEKDPSWQLVVFSKQTRITAENWLGTQGYHRIVTKMGQGPGEQRILYKVYSPRLKVTRYAAGAVNSTKEELIKEANISMLRWLNSGTHTSFAIRHSMRSTVKSTYNETGVIFEANSVVTRTPYFDNQTVKDFRAIVTRVNKEAIINFINSNTGSN